MAFFGRGLLDNFMKGKASPFVVFLIFTSFSFIVSATYLTVLILSGDVLEYSLVNSMMLEGYADNLPILMKLSNRWGFGGYYNLARDIYAFNILFLCFALIYNSRVSGAWQIDMVDDIDQETVEDQDDRLNRIEFLRKVAFFMAILLSICLLFDNVAEDSSDYFSNRVMFEPWNAMRIPLLTGLIYGCLTYLMASNHIFLFFFDDEYEDDLQQTYYYDYGKNKVEEGKFEDIQSPSGR